MKTTHSNSLWSSILLLLLTCQVLPAKIIHRQLKLSIEAYQTLNRDTLSRVWEEFLLLDETDWMELNFDSPQIPKSDQFRFSRTAAKEFMEYAKSQGIAQEHIQIQYSPKAKITMYRAPTYNALSSRLNPEALPNQSFSFINKAGQICELSSGHKVHVPPLSFATHQEAVVVLVIKEALSKSAFLSAGLTAQSNSRMLTSNGMFHLAASSEGKPIQLKSQHELILELNQELLQDQSNLNQYISFYGEVKNNQINWIPAYQEKIKLNSSDKRTTESLDGNDKEEAERRKMQIIQEKKNRKAKVESKKIAGKNEWKINTEWEEERELDTVYTESYLSSDNLSNSLIGSSGEKAGEEYSKVYLQISKLGWINCDRFEEYESKANLLVQIDPSTQGGQQVEVYAIFQEINSIMPGYHPLFKPKYTKFKNLPVGESVLIVAIIKSKTEVKFAYAQQKIGSDPVLHLNLKSYPNAQYLAMMNDLLPN